MELNIKTLENIEELEDSNRRTKEMPKPKMESKVIDVSQSKGTYHRRNYDWSSLKFDRHISDDVVNSFSSLIMKKYPGMLVTNTQFYPALVNKGWDGVSHWKMFNTSRTLTKEWIKQSRYLAIPVHVPGHWFLMAYSHSKGKIEVYDSFHTSLKSNLSVRDQEEMQKKINIIRKQQALRLVKDLLEPIFRRKLSIDIAKKDAPRQKDFDNCGVYLIEYLRGISEGTGMTFDRKTAQELRNNILLELEQGKIKDSPRKERSQDPKEGCSRMNSKEHEGASAKRKTREYEDERKSREGSSKRTKREHSNSKESNSKSTNKNARQSEDTDLVLNIGNNVREELEKTMQELETGLNGKEKSWANTKDMRRNVVKLLFEKIDQVQHHFDEGLKAFEELKYHSKTIKNMLKNLEGHVEDE